MVGAKLGTWIAFRAKHILGIPAIFTCCGLIRVQGPARFGLANIEFLTPGERGDLPAGQLAPFPTSWPYNKRRSVEN